MSIQLKAQHQTEIYINENGYFAIKQESYPDEPVVVELSPDQMRMTIKAMQRALKIKGDWWRDAISDGDF